MPDEPERLDLKGVGYFDSEGFWVVNYGYYKKGKELEFPIYPKGRQIPGQAFGCLEVPKHGGF